MLCGCLALTVQQRRAAVVHHRHLPQLRPFTDVRQEGATTFDLLSAQLGRRGIDLQGVMGKERKVRSVTLALFTADVLFLFHSELSHWIILILI